MRELNDRERAALGALQELLAEILEAIRQAIILAMPWLIRILCVMVCAGGTMAAVALNWQSYGGDGLAIIPAAVLSMIPLALVLRHGLGLGGFFFAGAAAAGAAVTVAALPIWARMLVLVSLAGVGVAAQFHKPAVKNGGE